MMDIKTSERSAAQILEGRYIWVEFEERRLAFWALVRSNAEATDQELARLPAYNLLLHYGLTAYRSIGSEACRVLALALLHGHPEPLKAEAVLQRFWAGLLPEGSLGQQLPFH